MVATATIRVWWAAYWAVGYDTTITFLGRPGAKATFFTLAAWRALEAAIASEGYGSAAIVSTYYPRAIAGYPCDMHNGGYGCSLHGYSGCAIDIDPALNPFIKGTSWDFSRCKFTKAQVDAALAIRTNNGKQVWRWGGDFGDYMHWQMNCAPEDIATGIDWSTVPDWDGATVGKEDEMIQSGDKGPQVGKIQQALLDQGYDLPEWGADEDFGGETKAAVIAFQSDEGLPETGSVGGVTAAFLLGGVPGPEGPQGPRGKRGFKGETPDLADYVLVEA